MPSPDGRRPRGGGPICQGGASLPPWQDEPRRSFMSEQGEGAGALYSASYDAGTATWLIELEEGGAPAAPVAVAVGGLRWVVDALAPGEPLGVEVDGPA